MTDILLTNSKITVFTKKKCVPIKSTSYRKCAIFKEMSPKLQPFVVHC